MDSELIQFTDSRVKAGDPSCSYSDSIDLTAGTRPYCFKLNNEHPEGALSAVAPYKPWWEHTRQDWGPHNESRKKFINWSVDKKSKTEKDATHVGMDMAYMHIPMDQEDEFLQHYAKCLLSGHRMYFVEQLRYDWHPPCFRLFMDLDFEQLAPITERGIEAASSVCAKTIARFFPNRKSHTIVTSTTYKESIKDNTKLIKTGIHLYWPKHYVTPLQCLHLRESLISDLIEIFGMRSPPEMNLWEDVVDKSVYGKANGGGGSGLRMLGSCKTKDCSNCKGQKKRGCSDCSHGKTDDRDMSGRVGRPYMMLCVLKEPDENGNVNRRDYELEETYQNSMITLIRDTKIRTHLTELTLNNGFVIPKGAPIFIDTKGQKKKFIGHRERHIDSSDPINMELQTLIRSSFGQLYSNIVVRKVTKGAQAKHFTITITGQNCRYCQNIGREHNSQNIYFVASREGIVQRCFDTGEKTPEMQFGLCREYSSAHMAINTKSASILWPETQTFTEFSSDPHDSKNESFLLKALINNIDYHCNELYPDSPSWPSVAKFRKIGRGSTTDFMIQDPRDLGTKGAKAYHEIGMLWSESLLQLISSKKPTLDDQPREEPKSIKFYETKVLECFTSIVTIACGQDPDKYSNCVSLDDFIE